MAGVRIVHESKRSCLLTIVDSTRRYRVPLQCPTCGRQPLTGVSARFTVKRRIDDLDAAAVTAKTIGSGVTVTDADAGKLTVKLAPADTSGLTGTTTLVWDLQLTDASGNVNTVDKGDLVVEADISRTAP